MLISGCHRHVTQLSQLAKLQYGRWFSKMVMKKDCGIRMKGEYLEADQFE